MTTATEPTPDTIKALWAFMSGHLESQIIVRGDAVEMRIVGWVLDRMGIVNKERFKTNFATTFGKRIYLPFNIGDDNDPRWPLWVQLLACVHEHQHVVQYDKEGQRFLIKYVLRPAARTLYEAEAFRCHMELEWWRTKTLPTTDYLIESMTTYNLRPMDLQVARKMFDLSRRTVEVGGITNKSSQLAIRWLNANAPDLKLPTTI